MGKRSGDIAAILGYAGKETLIHRDDLVMLLADMQQPEQLYAPLHERFLARLIDGIITLPFLQIATAIFASNEGIASIVGFLLGLLYYAWFAASNWQATPGKRIVGLYITDASGARLPLKEAFAREIAVLVPTFPVYVSIFSPEMAASLFLLLGMLWYGRILATPERTGMHDILCETRVRRGRVGSLWNAS